MSFLFLNRIHRNNRRDGLYKENLLLRGCTVRNTEEAVGIVIYAGTSHVCCHLCRLLSLFLCLTLDLLKCCFWGLGSSGHETKAMLNNNGPRYKRSKLERQMNVDVFWCVIILLVMCLLAAIGMF